jgi:hypothetical protein
MLWKNAAEDNVPVQHIHTFLAHPRKGSIVRSKINGAPVKLEGKLFELLWNIYEKSETECDIDITLSSNKGRQQNDCRDLICRYLNNPTLPAGKSIAERLEKHTDGRSGLGLLFLISGKESKDHKIVISRFPTDNAIYVDENPENLTVEFLERVFMKNKASYKAVSYRGSSLQAGLWSGRAIDKQLNSPTGELSAYWIVDFLASEFTVTSAAGTRRLASGLRVAAKNADLEIKQEIIAVATLARGRVRQRLSIDEFGDGPQSSRGLVSAEDTVSPTCASQRAILM